MKKGKKVILGSLLTMVTMLFVAVAYKQQAQTQDEVTVIQQNRQITDRERAYNNVYGRSRYTKSRKKLSEINGSEVNSILNAYVDSATNGNDPTLSREQIIAKRICDADAVIIGRAESKTTHLNSDETLIYSEYDISVQEILKNNSTSPIQTNNIIQVARTGGSIRLNGRLVKLIDGKSIPLQKGSVYLLFLTYIPEINSYIPPVEGNDYLLQENRATPTLFNPNTESQPYSEDASSLLNFIRTVVPSSEGCIRK